MREILFRGLDKRHGFVYGQPESTSKGITGIQLFDERGFRRCYTVDPKTVGEFTGIPDTTGKKVFEGDIVKCGEHIAVICFGTFSHTNSEPIYCVGFYPKFTKDDDMLRHDLMWWKINGGLEVIGDIHTTPDLMGVNV